MAHARGPDRDQAILARYQIGDVQGEVPIERKRWQRLRERVRRQSAQPPGQPQSVCSLTQRLARADEVEGALALLDRRIAGHQREQQPRKAVGQVLDLAGAAGELGDVAAIAGVEGSRRRRQPGRPYLPVGDLADVDGFILLFATRFSARRRLPALTAQNGKMAS
jgi:hypothetical protein